jgi:hypothetical protein
LLAQVVFSQAVTVTSNEQAMSLGMQPALSVHVNGVDEKEAMKDFESYWKDNGARYESDNDEMKSTGYEPKDLKPSVFTLYAKADEEKDKTVIYLWAADGSQFVNKSHPAFKHFEEKMKAYGVAENKKPVEKQWKEAERALEKAAGDRTSLERQRTNWQKDIDDCNQTIQETQAKLKDSEADLIKTADRVKALESDNAKLKQQIDGIQ